MRAELRGVGKGAASGFLALILLLQGALSGQGALRVLGPAFDPTRAAICGAHPGPADTSDGEDKAPPPPHDLCCILLCGAAAGPLPGLLPAADHVLPRPSLRALGFGRLADWPGPPVRRHVRHGARAPPLSA